MQLSVMYAYHQERGTYWPSSSKYRVIHSHRKITLIGLATLVLSSVYLLAVLSKVHESKSSRALEWRDSELDTPIFCLIYTYSTRTVDVAPHVKRLWATHCDRVLFVSDKLNGELENVMFEDYADKWRYSREVLEFVYKHHNHEIRWLLWAKDDNFFIIENLRKLLKAHSPHEPISFGLTMKDNQNLTYLADEPGYVLSKEALRRFVKVGLTNSTLCSKNGSDYREKEVGKCLRNVGVTVGDSRAKDGSITFWPFSPLELQTGLDKQKLRILEEYAYKASNDQYRLSKDAISFGHISPNTMYTLYYFIYKLRVFGKRHSGKLKQEERTVK